MIFIDDRAGSRDLINYSILKDVSELTRLDSADVMFVGNGPKGPASVGIEVKSIWELISSISTGRLQATQIPAMLEQYDISWLLHYGYYKPDPNGYLLMLRGGAWKVHCIGKRPLPYSYVEGLLMDLAALGVHIKRVADLKEAALWIRILYTWQTKPWSKHKGLRKFDKSHNMSLPPGMDEDTYLRARIAACLPGVGYERAVAVAAHFSDVPSMIGSTAAGWEQVPGIGKVIANAIVRALRRRDAVKR